MGECYKYVYSCPTEMLGSNYKDFLPREKNAQDALVVYYLIYNKHIKTTDKRELYQEAIAWDRKVARSSKCMYAWTGRVVKVRIPEVILLYMCSNCLYF